MATSQLPQGKVADIYVGHMGHGTVLYNITPWFIDFLYILDVPSYILFPIVV